MNFLLIKKSEEDSKSSFDYWKLVLAKSILLLGVCSVLTQLIILTPTTSQAIPIRIIALMIFIILFISCRTQKSVKIIGWVICSVFSIVTVKVSSTHPLGVFTPIFPQFFPILFLSFVLLGRKIATAFFLFFNTYLIGFGLKLYGQTDLSSVLANIEHYANTAIIMRIIAMVTSFAVIFLLAKTIEKSSTEVIEYKRKEQIQQNTQILKKVASGFAHEINNPLAIIDGYLNILSNDLAEANKKENMKKNAESAVFRIQSTVAKFLSVFSINDMEDSKFDLKQAVSQGISSANLYSEFSNNIPDGVIITGKVKAFCQIIELLSKNASEAVSRSKDEKIISTSHLEWRFSKPNILQCIDNGHGFRDFTFDNALEPFSTSKNQMYNVGLGLFTVKTICDNLGFEIKHMRVNNKTIIELALNE